MKLETWQILCLPIILRIWCRTKLCPLTVMMTNSRPSWMNGWPHCTTRKINCWQCCQWNENNILGWGRLETSYKTINLTILSPNALCRLVTNRPVSQMWVPLGGLSRTSGKLWQDYSSRYMFLNIKRNIFQSMLHTHALGYFDIRVISCNRFRRVKFVIIPPCFVQQQYLWNIALQPSVGCYNIWADLRYSGCSPLKEKSLGNGTMLGLLI